MVKKMGATLRHASDSAEVGRDPGTGGCTRVPSGRASVLTKPLDHSLRTLALSRSQGSVLRVNVILDCSPWCAPRGPAVLGRCR